MDEERIITAKDVLKAVGIALLGLAAIVAIYALIWGAWPAFRVSLTIIVTLIIIAAIGDIVRDLIKAGK